MMWYRKCEKCGDYSDDGGVRRAVVDGTVRENAWLCPPCFADDDEEDVRPEP